MSDLASQLADAERRLDVANERIETAKTLLRTAQHWGLNGDAVQRWYQRRDAFLAATASPVPGEQTREVSRDPRVATQESIGCACKILDGVKFASQEDQWRAVDAVALYIDAGLRDKQPPAATPLPAAAAPRETGPETKMVCLNTACLCSQYVGECHCRVDLRLHLSKPPQCYKCRAFMGPEVRIAPAPSSPPEASTVDYTKPGACPACGTTALAEARRQGREEGAAVTAEWQARERESWWLISEARFFAEKSRVSPEWARRARRWLDERAPAAPGPQQCVCRYSCGEVGCAMHCDPSRPTPEVAPDVPDVLRDAALLLLLERPNLPKKVTAYAKRWEQRLGELLGTPEFLAWRARRSPGGGR
jgi:hypothetical protein